MTKKKRRFTTVVRGGSFLSDRGVFIFDRRRCVCHGWIYRDSRSLIQR